MDTDYHLSFPTPEGTLLLGPDAQQIKAALYLEGAPGVGMGELFLYEEGIEVQSLWSGPVSGTESAPLTITGTFNAQALDASEIEARFVGTDISGSGATAKLYAMEWNVATVPAPPVEPEGILELDVYLIGAQDLKASIQSPLALAALLALIPRGLLPTRIATQTSLKPSVQAPVVLSGEVLPGER